MLAAAARAAHLIVDAEPYVFEDTLAPALLGDRADELLAYHRLHGDHPVLVGARTQVVCRARYTEARLAAAVGRGVRQYVVLGAGLDTFAYRSPLAGTVHVVEVDHPATQEWKRARLADAGLAPRGAVTYVPADLEVEDLTALLAGPGAGLDAGEPALVSWLGVTMYLTGEAIAAVLDAVARLAPGSELVTDHLLPPPDRDAPGQLYADLVAPVAAGQGEPWRTALGDDDWTALTAAHGLLTVEHVRQQQLLAAVGPRTDALTPASLTCLTRCTVPRKV